ncbi:MAG: hypothetical protein GX181_10295 [Synergistaceae bacterium]|nr:hypothetical protein [Synergistota bacterium]NLM72329.1 hypothetical protein [Synergistaceae bacterium]
MAKYLFKRLLYFGTILAVTALAVSLYTMWWEQSALEAPDLVTAVPYVHKERFPVKGALVWEESLVISPGDGTVSFAAPRPHRVARGETIAMVEGPSGRTAVRADTVGYFVPGLDGAEGEWRYAALWPGMAPLPEPPDLLDYSAGVIVRRGMPIGKMIPQPQELRCVLYTDLSPSLEKDIAAGFVRVKKDRHGWAAKANVRAVTYFGARAKLYLTLPFFPVESVLSRGIKLLLESGESQGVVLPESAVLYREGRLGVLLVEGNVAGFREIIGLPVEGRRFFVQKGLRPGNLVVLDADGAKEGKIRLW